MAHIKVKKVVARNPKKSSRNKASRKRKNVASKRRTHRAKQNPVPVLVSMGAVNPRRRKTVAKSRVEKASRKHPARRSKNPSVKRTAHAKPHRRNKRHNPEVFGRKVGSADTLKMILGGLIGVTVTKTAVGMLPPSLLSNGLVRVVATGALAFGTGALAKETGLGPAFADAVTFGGLMQAGSTALTEFIPGGAKLALSGVRRGVGELSPAYFTTPNNPLKLAAAKMSQAAAIPPPGAVAAAGNGVTGIRRVFQSRF